MVIKHSKKSPVTTFYRASSIVPQRIVIYRAVKVVPDIPCFGLFTLSGETRLATRAMRDNGLWGAWSMLGA